jgi:hypothetical protein
MAVPEGSYNTTFPEPNKQQDTVSLTSKWGGLSIGGKDALDIFLFIAIVGLGGLTIYEHIQRSTEHQDIQCQIKLNLYMQQQIPEKPINWRAMPTDLYGCIPRWLYERDSNVRG